ncbi:MAG: HDOD domain-containing protein [Candidatus Eisenbacteria bacterium]|uniref:HDOD domain-containing protein n=1 Tax=Eiseniibacteriota bacterium TaxID=2212470 RepID=A0A956LY13_UNCEI|nr:HDOD domain-containing protein [Candidatus Eisenbacteria bacterium]
MTARIRENDPRLQDRVKRNINRIQNLPALSDVVAKIVALAEDPKVSGQEVAEIVGRDQAMVTAILKIVNSPFYGLNRRVSSINHAIVLLGYRTIRNIALSTSLVNTFSGPEGDARFDRKRFWTHAVCTAAAAKLVARRLRDTDSEEAFLAGLIHDMGRIVFSHYFGPEFTAVLTLWSERKMDLLEAERVVLGMDHAEAGALVARKWNFPAAVAEAIGAHHDATRAAEVSELATCVYLANQLTQIGEERLSQSSEAAPAGPPSAELLEAIDADLRERFELTPESLEQLLAELEGEMEKARTFLDALNV